MMKVGILFFVFFYLGASGFAQQPKKNKFCKNDNCKKSPFGTISFNITRNLKNNFNSQLLSRGGDTKTQMNENEKIYVIECETWRNPSIKNLAEIMHICINWSPKKEERRTKWVAHILHSRQKRICSGEDLRTQVKTFRVSDEDKAVFGNVKNEHFNVAYEKDCRYQKGHLAPAGDFEEPDRSLTYQYINSAPQDAVFNTRNWKLLEEGLRTAARKCGPFKITTGTIVGNGDRKFLMGGENRGWAIIPEMFYKIVFFDDMNFENRNECGIEKYVFLGENNCDVNSKVDLKSYCSVAASCSEIKYFPEDTSTRFENQYCGRIHCCLFSNIQHKDIQKAGEALEELDLEERFVSLRRRYRVILEDL